MARLLDFFLTIYFWLIIAFGIGLGLLASFIVELKLQKQEPQQDLRQE